VHLEPVALGTVAQRPKQRVLSAVAIEITEGVDLQFCSRGICARDRGCGWSLLGEARGRVVGRWRIESELRRGSAGAVFKARDAQGTPVAIKLLLPEWRAQEHLLQRFVREARVLMRLSTPHVGKLLYVGNLDPEEGDLPYLVLEYLEGEDLDRLIRRQVGHPCGHRRHARAEPAPCGLQRAHAVHPGRDHAQNRLYSAHRGRSRRLSNA
jgi:hypothetical protein